MTEKIDSLQEKLRALELVFVQKLPSKFEEISAAMQLYIADRSNRDALVVLHRHLHTMAGSAGTFGFDAIGAQARVFESQMKPWLDQVVASHGELLAFAAQMKQYFQTALEALKTPAHDSAELPRSHAEETLEADSARLIYLVDEDSCQQQAITVQLEHFGYEVVRIALLKDLALAVATRRPDVIVIELIFPEGRLAGAEEIQKIEQLQRLRIPTIFVSKSSSFESRLLAVRARGDGYFTKPVDVVTLTERIDAILQRDVSNGYRILIVDDDTVTSKFYGAILRDAGMNVRLLNDPTQILGVMTEFRPELLLLDVYMPVCSGVELSHLIRQDNSYVDVPIVFLSSEADLGEQLLAVRAGADDFITKPVAPEYLISSLSTRAERYRSLRALIMRDGLTGLYNHTAIKEQLASEILQAGRNGAHLALAMIDLDNFKQVNDNYGHATGDQVLRTLARLLRQRLRRSDIVGRYGGEEFAIIFPDTTASTARRVLEQVRLAFANIRQHAEEVEFSVSFSGGVADLEASTDADELFDVADAAMYISKQSGRNRISLA
ncbi:MULTISPECIES: diguanylate cyclase [unclassified Undibacterium]|uniref:diguanylate cyclase n=1 Tax=unclassified Undibacterium TaxID=2630295 RepID=UPI002AC95A0E|nr:MULTISPECIES: diguanylate cyclase [unclassified Undibacterium]MEB0139640.1 diguanylate cyclase [Undibacterium sp. CCC2.1]MEB0171996.1 diguanylate cyclase [Undibacterium sp. CCC1.1]MEB0176309.1 diguanylate cyclase [Undibacterium sp. CCC3.4]MEB0213991.1 diguanylate cyclase [Undibacterium sp. 5I2]WPX43607.1 diguanylate cyclase [Undibacterium sp. CCC3.4]